MTRYPLETKQFQQATSFYQLGYRWFDSISGYVFIRRQIVCFHMFLTVRVIIQVQFLIGTSSLNFIILNFLFIRKSGLAKGARLTAGVVQRLERQSSKLDT